MDLVGGESRVTLPWRWGDSFIANLGVGDDRPWQPPSPEAGGWHKDGDFFRHFLDSPEQALLTFVLWTDMLHKGGGWPRAASNSVRSPSRSRERKARARGASAALFVPAFLLLARTGLLRWYANHQRVVQTFVTNLRGPEDRLTFGGAAVRATIPIPSTTGNVTVTFAAMSYARTLRITILSDPDRTPDAPALAAALRHELSVPVAHGPTP